MPALALVAPFVSAVATLLLISWLLRSIEYSSLDVPNPRSLHSHPVPRSGGIAIAAGIFSGFAMLQAPIVLVLSAALLVVVSYFDDLYRLPIPARFSVQLVAAIAFAYSTLAVHPFPIFLLTVIGILWGTNLYNFMDGSDGLAGGMAVLGFSFLGVGAWVGGDETLLAECTIVGAAAAAFLLFNFPPARIFMGEAGSIPIGFLATALSLIGWHGGIWPAWFPAVVFSPFIADASLTLMKRLAVGERVWKAHNQHYYQRLVRMGWNHRRTALAEYALMFVSGAAALWALGQTPDLQFAAVLGMITLYATLALWVDSAWRRNGNHFGSA